MPKITCLLEQKTCKYIKRIKDILFKSDVFWRVNKLYHLKDKQENVHLFCSCDFVASANHEKIIINYFLYANFQEHSTYFVYQLCTNCLMVKQIFA